VKHSGIEPITVFPAWLQNMLAAVVLFFVVIMTAFFIHEYLMLTSADGDAGYPFGSEEAGPGYATKEIYLARSRWLIAVGGTLSLSMVYALWRKRMVLLWGLTLLTLFGALFPFLQTTT
jgi:hypothetical protein